jgi:NAD(P)-dependent dehydrogenase (short-subunit alcohol dehydrogenase family)
MAAERQVAIVTGAASAIGRAMSLSLLESGIDVAAIDKEAVWLDELEEEARSREAAGKCGAPIAWKSIATMPIEPD